MLDPWVSYRTWAKSPHWAGTGPGTRRFLEPSVALSPFSFMLLSVAGAMVSVF